MRHRKKVKKLGRTSAHRKTTLAALSTALIENKRITTTVPKAKALRPFVEPLITRAKEDTQHNRKEVFRHLQNKRAVSELFTEVAVQVGDRPGGYTRVIKLGRRSGDGAELAMIELVDYNDVQPEGGGSSGSGSSGTRRGSGKGRRRRSSKKKEAQAAAETAEAEEETQAEASEADAAEDTADVEASDTETAETDTAEAKATDEPTAEAEEAPEASDDEAAGEDEASDEDTEDKK